MKRILALYGLTNKYKNDNNNKWIVEDIHDGLSVLRNIFGYIFFFFDFIIVKSQGVFGNTCKKFLKYRSLKLIQVIFCLENIKERKKI